jgi:hypothetical protein
MFFHSFYKRKTWVQYILVCQGGLRQHAGSIDRLFNQRVANRATPRRRMRIGKSALDSQTVALII